MREILYHRHAVRYLRRMPEDRKIQVKAALAEAAALPDPLAHPQVVAMTGGMEGMYAHQSWNLSRHLPMRGP